MAMGCFLFLRKAYVGYWLLLSEAHAGPKTTLFHATLSYQTRKNLTHASTSAAAYSPPPSATAPPTSVCYFSADLRPRQQTTASDAPLRPTVASGITSRPSRRSTRFAPDLSPALDLYPGFWDGRSTRNPESRPANFPQYHPPSRPPGWQISASFQLLLLLNLKGVRTC